jgi:hypothetical protein
MIVKFILNTTCITGIVLGSALAQAPQQVAAAPADGITMDMMPITQDQLTQCRQQASSQLTDEQKTLHDREHGQDKDKMAQGTITGVTGAATSAISRKGGWWYGGNNNGAQTAAATGATQRTDRNSQAVASTTATSQTVGVDAYQQCVNGIKGPEYVHFRQTGQITGGSTPAPAAVAAAAAAPVAAPAPASAKSPVQDEGDGKHFVLTAPGQTDAREVTLVAGTKNSYIEESTGDKYIVMPDGGVTRIPHAKKVVAK